MIVSWDIYTLTPPAPVLAKSTLDPTEIFPEGKQAAPGKVSSRKETSAPESDQTTADFVASAAQHAQTNSERIQARLALLSNPAALRVEAYHFYMASCAHQAEIERLQRLILRLERQIADLKRQPRGQFIAVDFSVRRNPRPNGA